MFELSSGKVDPPGSQGTPARIRMTIRYEHLSPAHLADAVAAIETLGELKRAAAGSVNGG